MARRNYLIEGRSGTGKSSVCRELRRRGYRAVDGDNELAYQGDPVTGEPRSGTPRYGNHIWDVKRVREIAASREDSVAFFCGGSRNFATFLDVFDGVILLDVDLETVRRRLDDRTADDWGGTAAQKAFILRLHATGDGLPDGVVVDATRPLAEVVDSVLAHCPNP